MDLSEYGFMPGMTPDGTEAIPARITAVRKERYALVCAYGETYGRLKTQEYYGGMICRGALRPVGSYQSEVKQVPSLYGDLSKPTPAEGGMIDKQILKKVPDNGLNPPLSGSFPVKGGSVQVAFPSNCV